jgi:hypothetical protein
MRQQLYSGLLKRLAPTSRFGSIRWLGVQPMRDIIAPMRRKCRLGDVGAIRLMVGLAALLQSRALPRAETPRNPEPKAPAGAIPISATIGQPVAEEEEPLPPGALARFGSTRFRHPCQIHSWRFRELTAPSEQDFPLRSRCARGVASRSRYQKNSHLPTDCPLLSFLAIM